MLAFTNKEMQRFMDEVMPCPYKDMNALFSFLSQNIQHIGYHLSCYALILHILADAKPRKLAAGRKTSVPAGKLVHFFVLVYGNRCDNFSLVVFHYEKSVS